MQWGREHLSPFETGHRGLLLASIVKVVKFMTSCFKFSSTQFFQDSLVENAQEETAEVQGKRQSE